MKALVGSLSAPICPSVSPRSSGCRSICAGRGTRRRRICSQRVDPELWEQVGRRPGGAARRGQPEAAGRAGGRRLVPGPARRPGRRAGHLPDPADVVPGSRPTAGVALPNGIAYFSMEFGVAEVLPNYSGGLGILAGDHLKSASDLGLPLIAVGLLLPLGVLPAVADRRRLAARELSVARPAGPAAAAAHRRRRRTGAGRSWRCRTRPSCNARVWIAQVGRIPLLLLDSDIPENEHELRGVTDRLYGGDQEHRIKQEILAGIGGVRAIRAFTASKGCPTPEVFHMNEGHAGFLGVERIRELIDAGLDFDTALTVVRSGTVFTTHTPVPAGIDRFPVEMVKRYFGSAPAARRGRARGCCPACRWTASSRSARRTIRRSSTWRTWACGWRSGPTAYRCCTAGSAGTCSTSCGRGSTPARCRSARSPTVCTRRPGRRRSGWSSAASWSAARLGSREPAVWERLQQVDPGHLWWIRSQLRELLVDDVRARLRRSWLERGASDAELGWIATAFDPDVLTIGFARRVPTYKRLTLMLRDPDRLEKLLLDEKRPIQLIVAGKSHPADDGGKALIQQVVRFADRPEVRHRIAFLPDYDMSMARLLYWGCDVWLNNPLRPLEACGTSGMKSALNGGLNLSIRDGWWDEWYDGENGWEIPTADGVADETAATIWRPPRCTTCWRGRWRRSSTTATRTASRRAGSRWCATRCRCSAPRCWRRGWCATTPRSTTRPPRSRCTGPSSRRRTACRSARPGSWPPTASGRSEAWPKIQITDVDSYGLPDTPLLGSELTLTATVQLAGLRPDEVVVQAVVGTGGRRRRAGGSGDRADGAHRHGRRRQRGVLDDDAAAGGGSGRLHGAGAAAPPAAGRRQRAGSRHAGVSGILEVAVAGGPYALTAGSGRCDVGDAGAQRRDRPRDRQRWSRRVSGCAESKPSHHRGRGRTVRCGSPGLSRDDRIGRITTDGWTLSAVRPGRGSAPFGLAADRWRVVVHRDDVGGMIGGSASTVEITDVAAPGGMPRGRVSDRLWHRHEHVQRCHADRQPSGIDAVELRRRRRRRHLAAARRAWFRCRRRPVPAASRSRLKPGIIDIVPVTKTHVRGSRPVGHARTGSTIKIDGCVG